MKGILLKEPLFHLTIQKKKTQTRRVIREKELLKENPKPRYKPGEVVYIKEPTFDDPDLPFLDYKYDLDSANPERKKKRWRNKLFMPMSDARHFIRIDAVRRQRLQYILFEEAVKEGFESLEAFQKEWGHLNGFSGPYSWNKNPEVWVYDYHLFDYRSQEWAKEWEPNSGIKLDPETGFSYEIQQSGRYWIEGEIKEFKKGDLIKY